MSITKLKTIGNRALPPTNDNQTPVRPLTGRVIVGMLTGEEAPVPTNLTATTSAEQVLTSAKDRRRR